MKTVRVIIVNTDEAVAADLRAVLLSLDGVKIVAEIDEPSLLAQALDSFPAEVLLVHLDPIPGAMMDVVAPIIEGRKDQIAAIGMTEDRDAELVMRAMRAGMKEFLWKPFPPEQLRDILGRVAADADSGGRRLGRLITVVGTAGGVGATHLATNLAVELATLESWHGQPDNGAKPRVAIVDMDFRIGQVAMQLDAAPPYSIAELTESPESIDVQMIERAMFRHATGVHVLARPPESVQAERISGGACAAALAALQEHYDFVVADLPSRFDPTARAVFDMADTYLLVLQLMVPCVRAADRMLHDLAMTGYAMQRVSLVCNRHGRESGYLGMEDVESTLKRKFDHVIPDEWRTSAAAVNMGAPLLLHAPKSKLRAAIRDVAVRLAGDPAAAAEPAVRPAAEPARKGLFSIFAGAAAKA
ncbi:MAG: hypothetical protein IT450_17345 [Phycisphaerales bacterium]|nr:hypothetical protein [Phycisphaerales bacterium]